MADSERESISKLRMRLENPYAYIEQLGAAALETDTSTNLVSASRKLLENPYAYLADHGGYEADVIQGSAHAPAVPSRWSNEQITLKVRELHGRLWRDRQALWSNAVPKDPIELLDPAIALEAIGFRFDLEEGLGQMPGRNGQIEVAGLIDTKAKVVRVGRQFSASVRAFTAAHELGHAVLHPTLDGLHRDKPLDGSPSAADRVEVEANKFATLFLMPARLVCTRFAELFQGEPFELSEESAFALAGCSLSDFNQSQGTRRQLARVLSSAQRYNGRHFTPLNEQFRVSREAMAIRLEELGIVPVDG